MQPPEQKQKKKRQVSIHREEQDPGFQIVEVEQLDKGSSSMQHFAFDVDVLEPLVAVLPMQAVPGWTAMLDGEPTVAFPTGPDMVGVFLPKGAHRLVFHWKMPVSE